MRTVVIYVWHGKAYLPVQGQLESGPFVGIEPIFRANLNPEELSEAMQKVLEAGHPRLPDSTLEDMRKRRDPVLSTMKARSWKELARAGASYAVDWTEQAVRVDISRLDKHGRWEYDPHKTRFLPPNASVREVVAIILDDVQQRKELEESRDTSG